MIASLASAFPILGRTLVVCVVPVVPFLAGAGLRVVTASAWSALVPDLVVQDLSVKPASASSTSNVTVEFRIRNVGDSEQGSVRYEVRVDDAVVATGEGNTGERVRVNIGRLATGVRRIEVHADTDNHVAESNEDNNSASTSLLVTDGSLPDYQVSQLKITPNRNATTDSDVRVQFRVKNRGASDAGEGPMQCGALVDGRVVQRAPCSSNQRVSFDLGRLGAGGHVVGGIVDVDGAVGEGRDDDNSDTRAFAVIDPAGVGDFYLENVFGIAGLDTVTFQFDICWDGNQNSPPVRTGAWTAPPAAIACGSTPAGELTWSGIPPGTCEQARTITIVTDLLEFYCQDFEVGVFVDHACEVPETNETNNFETQLMTVPNSAPRIP